MYVMHMCIYVCRYVGKQVFSYIYSIVTRGLASKSRDMKLSQRYWCCFRSSGRGRQFSSRTATLKMEAASSVETLRTIIDMTSYPWMLASPSMFERLVVSPDSEILQAVGLLLGFCYWLNQNIFLCFPILLRYNIVLFLLAENLLAVWVTISFSGMPVLHVVTIDILYNQASTSHPISLLLTSLWPHQGSCPYAQCVVVFKLWFTLPGSLRDPRKLALFNDIFNCWSYIA